MDNNVLLLLDNIKENYKFQNDKELITLLEYLADKKSKGVTYWDYIEVETLLTLQRPKTDYPDENIFIIYHQITELYFKMILNELDKIVTAGSNVADITEWEFALTRISRYWRKLIISFDILKNGMEKVQFNSFRKALLPASGFQTYQFRLIEIMLTPMKNLIKFDLREDLPSEFSKEDIDKYYDNIYWRYGAINKENNDKAKILVNFNNHYDRTFKDKLNEVFDKNLYSKFKNANSGFQRAISHQLEELEKMILLWKLAHLASISGYLREQDSGTGGTAWNNYLPIVKQRIFYFPEFWDDIDQNDVVGLNKKIKRMIEEFKEKIAEDSNSIF